MQTRWILSLGSVATALLAACAGRPAPEPPPTVAFVQPPPMAIQQCEALAGTTIPAAAIGLPTSGATITTAERAAEVAPYKDAEGEHLLPTPACCSCASPTRRGRSGIPATRSSSSGVR